MNKKLTNLLLGLIDELDHETENKQMKMIFRLQKENKDKFLEEVADISLRYDVVDNVLNIPVAERKTLKRKISLLIDDVTSQERVKEVEVVKNLLTTNATERYLMNTYFYSKTFDIDYSMKQLSDKAITKVINNKVKGEVWSDRLWRNKKGMNKVLRKELYDYMDGKTDVNEISRLVSDRYKQSFSKSRTLVRTEATRVQNEVNEEWASENGIEEQLFVATLDNSTSDICEELDGNTYDIDDPNKPDIPDDTHPNCRSCLVNVPYKDWKPSMRRDNITKQNINYVDYKHWKGSN